MRPGKRALIVVGVIAAVLLVAAVFGDDEHEHSPRHGGPRGERHHNWHGRRHHDFDEYFGDAEEQLKQRHDKMIQCRQCVVEGSQWCGVANGDTKQVTSDTQGVCVARDEKCPDTVPMSVTTLASCANDAPSTKMSCTLCTLDAYTWQRSGSFDEYNGACVARNPGAEPTAASKVVAQDDEHEPEGPQPPPETLPPREDGENEPDDEDDGDEEDDDDSDDFSDDMPDPEQWRYAEVADYRECDRPEREFRHFALSALRHLSVVGGVILLAAIIIVIVVGCRLRRYRKALKRYGWTVNCRGEIVAAPAPASAQVQAQPQPQSPPQSQAQPAVYPPVPGVPLPPAAPAGYPVPPPPPPVAPHSPAPYAPAAPVMYTRAAEFYYPNPPVQHQAPAVEMRTISVSSVPSDNGNGYDRPRGGRNGYYPVLQQDD